jgi:hypothetical protein
LKIDYKDSSIEESKHVIGENGEIVAIEIDLIIEIKKKGRRLPTLTRKLCSSAAT